MPIIGSIPFGLEVYAYTEYKRHVEPSEKCPNCGTRDSLEPPLVLLAGDYQHRAEVLPPVPLRQMPSFVHRDRRGASATVDQFFGGAMAAFTALWVPLLAQREIQGYLCFRLLRVV
jgi:hypothetical protein